jgi:hypothetical protein
LGHIARGCKNVVDLAFGEDEHWGAKNAQEPSNIALMPQDEPLAIARMPQVEPSTIAHMPQVEPSTVAHMPQVEPSTVALMPQVEPCNVAPARYCSFSCLFYCDM